MSSCPSERRPYPSREAAVREALSQPIGSRPLSALLRPSDTVAIVISDITRPVPNQLLLPPILETVADAGIPRQQVVIVNATGTHRVNTREELLAMVGPEVLDGYRIVQHDARDRDSLAFVTTSARGVEVLVNAEYLRADVKILTGFVEPHLFAGYSGGGKAVLPGIAGADIIMSNHGAGMLSHPKATWCETVGNPIFEEMRDVALATRPTFLVNVTLNEKKEITGVFAGEMVAAHDAGIAQAGRQALRPIPHLYDIAVTTNMGHPADINFYQAGKGASVAAARRPRRRRRHPRRRVRRRLGSRGLRGAPHQRGLSHRPPRQAPRPRLRPVRAVGRSVLGHDPAQGRLLPVLVDASRNGSRRPRHPLR